MGIKAPSAPWSVGLQYHDPIPPGRLAAALPGLGLVAPGRLRYHRGPATNP